MEGRTGDVVDRVAANHRAFVVLMEGMYENRLYHQGEILVCDTGTEHGGVVVLTARGPGRPRVGRVDETGVWGDAGEPCNPVRWEVAGSIARIIKGSAELTAACSALGGRPLAPWWAIRRSAVRSSRGGLSYAPRNGTQLSLFGVRAAA
jgi:hypothetical protein